MKHSKRCLAVLLVFCQIILCGCHSAQSGGTKTEGDNMEPKQDECKETERITQENTSVTVPDSAVEPAGKLTVDPLITYQTIESFGASGCWWSQYVGGWDQPYKDAALSTREQIARWLYDKEEGIGLTSYRYNLGGGSMEGNGGDYADQYRKAECFETAPGVYDYTKDSEAVWFLNRVVELGAEEVIFFCNSPLERLTITKRAYGDKNRAIKSNLLAKNYHEFAVYVMDVAEHFIGEGIPVKYISPINEPQWDWTGGQEGCHYEPAETTNLYLEFLDELTKRESLADVELSGPDSGEWGNKTTAYVSAILSNEALNDHFKTIDNHSYWTDAATKKSYKAWMDHKYPDKNLRMSEWCEMVNGSDYTMDSAFNMFDVIYEDLTILDVVSWQAWVAVAPGNYRDGLIYVNQEKKACRAAKRLWGYGNFTRFVRPGYTRVEVSCDESIASLKPSCYTGTNEKGQEELVLVLSNRESETRIDVSQIYELGYQQVSLHVTNEEKDLELTDTISLTQQHEVALEGASIITLVFTK